MVNSVPVHMTLDFSLFQNVIPAQAGIQKSNQGFV
jgi:hypothetical protein